MSLEVELKKINRPFIIIDSFFTNLMVEYLSNFLNTDDFNQRSNFLDICIIKKYFDHHFRGEFVQVLSPNRPEQIPVVIDQFVNFGIVHF
jgi:hypothetical protein